MNKLSRERQAQVIAALVEGSSINATVRMTGVSVAIHYMHYNFCRIHKTPRVTPAMQAGIADHVWTIEEMLDLASQKIEE